MSAQYDAEKNPPRNTKNHPGQVWHVNLIGVSPG